MATTFARLGYNNAGTFTPVNTRAQDVLATDGTSAEAHITNTAKHLSTEQIALITNAIQTAARGVANGVASLDADGKVPMSQLAISGFEVTQTVDDYNTLQGLSIADAPISSLVLVEDATGDSTVEQGWAIYFRKGNAGTAADWLKFAEGEGLDISFTDMEAAIAAAQQTADDAATAAALLDFAYCMSESDMASKNLRDGAMVLMSVSNDEVDA
jgi:hypothetical protein